MSRGRNNYLCNIVACYTIIALVDLFISLLDAKVLQETVDIYNEFERIALKSNMLSWDCNNTTIAVRFGLFSVI